MDTHYPSKFNWKVQKEQSYAPVSISHRSGQDQASEREQAARAARREGGGSSDPGDMRGAGAGVAGSQQTGVVTEARADTWNYECGLVTADPAQDKHKQHAT